jgi:hypothetical protein
VVAGRSDSSESAVRESVENVSRDTEEGSNRVESDVETAGCDVRVRIEAVVSGPDRPGDMLYMILPVGEIKDFKIRALEGNPIEVSADGRTCEELEDGGEPLRPLHVARGSVIRVIVVRSECYRHGGLLC